ncbi:hypothetical protein HAX54_021765 [Datura stramonium]|uniref:Late blight resistance protein R1A-like N-terminal domain-containing protein n=1 Tax=Datura stramonium TaxID=4076 RepID=A0ABS8Y489_DATST|nr:hypothetical protein [Datura stramonium]
MSSNTSHPLETLQQIEKEFSKKNMCSNTSHPLETLQLIGKEWDSFNMYSCDARIPKIIKRIKKECDSFSVFSNDSPSISNYSLSKLSRVRKTLRKIEHQCDLFKILIDDYPFPEEYDALDTLQRKMHNLLETSLQIGKLCLSSDDGFSLQRISDECDSLNSYLDEHLSLVDGLKFLKRDFKFLDIILNSQIIIDEPDVREILQVLFQAAAADVAKINPKQLRSRYHRYGIFDVQHKFRETKLKIRAKYSIPKISYKDGIVVPNIVMEFIDTVTENLCGLPKLNDPSSFLCVRGLMGQIKKALKELKVLRSFVYLVSYRCIEPQGQQTFLSHALEVAWHTITVTWLYFPSNRYGYLDSAPNEEYHLFSAVLGSKIQPIEPNICKMYIDVLKALKATIASNCETIKATLQEMLNILRTNLINLPTKALEFHLRDIDSVIIDAGLLVYSLIGNKHEKEVTALGETNQALIPSMKETIYFITRKSFLLRPNLPRIDGLGSTGFILENLQEFLGCHLD